MTPKNIRDIVAYWGASCIYRVNKPRWEDCSWDGVRDGYWTEPHYSDVDNAQVNQHLVAEIYADNTTIENFKLCLRSIASLTDEEVKQCFQLAFPNYLPNQPVERNWDNIYVKCSLQNYTEGIKMIMMLSINYRDGSCGAYFPETNGADAHLFAVCAYLHSIGVYVPGTIDEQYVQLI